VTDAGHAVRGSDAPGHIKRVAQTRSLGMTKYLITFSSDAMNHIAEEEMPDVAKAARACCQELIDAGVYLLAGGLEDQPSSIVGRDGTVTEGSNPDVVGGITVVDVPSREEALRWAAKIAAACRCRQEVREVGPDPELDAMLREAAGRRPANGR
jgi:hypothetical protein